MSPFEIGTVIGAAITAIAGAVAMILNTWHKNKQEADKAQLELNKANRAEDREDDENTIAQWRELYKLQQEQLNRQEQHSTNQDSLLAELFDLDTECQIRLAEQYGVMEWMHGTIARLSKKYADDDIGPVPPLPPRPDRKQSRQRAEFLMRQSAQDSATLASVTQAINDKPLPGTNGGNH